MVLNTKNPTNSPWPLPALKHYNFPAHNIKPKPALKVKLTKVTSPTFTAVVQDIIALK